MQRPEEAQGLQSGATFKLARRQLSGKIIFPSLRSDYGMCQRQPFMRPPPNLQQKEPLSLSLSPYHCNAPPEILVRSFTKLCTIKLTTKYSRITHTHTRGPLYWSQINKLNELFQDSYEVGIPILTTGGINLHEKFFFNSTKKKPTAKKKLRKKTTAKKTSQKKPPKNSP